MAKTKFTVSFEVDIRTEVEPSEDVNERDLILFAVKRALDEIVVKGTAHVSWYDQLDNANSLFVNIDHGVPQPSWRNEYYEEE